MATMFWDFIAEASANTSPQKRALADKPPDVDPAKALELQSEAQECNYEEDCTPLYSYIEAAVQDDDWNPIIRFLDTGKWPQSFFGPEQPADQPSPAQQTRTWVTRFDANDPTKVRWSQLPLHLAIVCNAPFAVVGRLIELYPQAVRCTDDQRMLPLHLALRHNASDDVVAYLLMQFPESVNAKGKDNRMPITCALRAPSKVRGKILEIFVKKTKMKHKIAMGGGTATDREISLLKSQLEAKTLALENAESKMAALEEFKAEMETELANKEEELERAKESSQNDGSDESIEDLQAKKLTNEIAFQKKLELLEAEKADLQESERKARKAESSLRVELESVTKAVTKTSPAELKKLKHEVQVLQRNRLEETRKEAKEQIDMLRKELEKSMKQSVGKTDQELKAMQATVTELRSAANNTRTNDELMSLRREVESLRSELKEREQANKTKDELEEMKTNLETELKNSEGKTKEELAALKRAVRSMNVNELETKTTDELTTLKKELASVKNKMQENELTYKTQRDVVDLKSALDRQMRDAKGVTYKELAMTRKTLDTIQDELEQGKSNTDLLALRKEVTHLKDEFKHKEKTRKLRAEMMSIRASLEDELKNTEGRSKSDLQSIKKAVKSVDEKTIQALSFDELSMHRGKLQELKTNMDLKDNAVKTRQEIEDLKKSLEKNEKEWEGKNKDDISTMKQAVDEMSVVPFEKKNSAELKSIKKELKTLREEVKVAEDATKTKQELDALKGTLEDALKTSEGKTADELYAMKRAVDSINVEQLEIRNKEEWDMIRTELNALKEDLKTKEAGEGLLKKEIAELRAQMPPPGQASVVSNTSATMKKKKSWKKKVFSRFRRNKDDGSPIGVSATSVPAPSPSATATSSRGVSATSVPVPSPAAKSFQVAAARDDEEDHHEDDEDDVRTIHPPSVHPGSEPDGDEGAESDEDDEAAGDASIFSDMVSKASMKSSRSTRAKFFPVKGSMSMPAKSGKVHDEVSTTSKSNATEKTSHTLKTNSTKSYKQATKAALAAHKISRDVDVDPETGETIYKGEEKKTDEGTPFSDAVSV